MRKHGEFVDAVVRTLGLALRRVRRAPGFSASVVLILTLGIGANAVMFGVVDRLLLSPPQHVIDADEVHLLHVRRRSLNPQVQLIQEINFFRDITYPDYQDLLGVAAFTDVALYSRPAGRIVGRGEAANQARVVGVSANLFPLLGVRPALGRFFEDGDDPLTANPTAVLAYEYWERHYGRDPGILGQTIDVGTVGLTIIGIAPAGFTGAELEPVDIWIPMTGLVPNVNNFATNQDYYRFRAVVRLAPGTAIEVAEAEATARHRGGRGVEITENRYDANAEVVIAPIIAARGPSPTSEAQVLRWLAGVSLVVLLIACFNVANLLLARSILTRREIAVRIALGAGRGRLIGELVTESLVLATIGAGAALLVARVLSSTVHQILLPNVAFIDVSLGGRLLGFTLVATLVSGLLTGLIPALQASKAELANTLRAGGHGVAGGRSKTRIGLIVGQVALSVVLLVGAGLFVQSLRSAQHLDLGFDSQNIVMVRLQFNESLEMTERRAIYQRALEGVRRLPGVHSAGLSRIPPFSGGVRIGVRVAGLDETPVGPGGGPWANMVSPGYFEALGLTILQGRGFEPADDTEEAPPVSVVSENMAMAIWPRGDALGACIFFEGYDFPCAEVVGIVENHHILDLVEDEPRFLYFYNRGPGQVGTLVAGTTGDAEALVNLIRDEVATASTQIRFVYVGSMTGFIKSRLRSWTLGASMFTAFGFLALMVAGCGLYSVLAFDVTLRQRELGIRSALGANVARLVRLVLSQAMLFVIAGVGSGLLASWAASRFVGPLLFQVSATDPLIYAIVAVVLLLVAVFAGSFPAWRATRVDPREALRAD